MSRVGKNPVKLVDGVNAEVNGQTVKVKGKLGELSMQVHDNVAVKLENGEIAVSPKDDSRETRALWATMRNLIKNMVQGVSAGYTKVLEIQGVGYRANLQGTNLNLQLGFSHDINFPVPEGIKMAVEKQTKITITGIDKQKVGQVAADIYRMKPPEPYKGKGIRYEGQQILRKEGKKK
ncbi:MAG: 50S ribosomal protein L6 [Micavibrio aeruginosavorus]|uniref:Large ribosomal subunit protein uL6 n=1 Tax=Micavibrio aeruginosavorus TaxID=349221 RepID=A0A7T5UGR9_9BACT|nr:MAG: 50S ribosomal protein L6 [Micavibrio aeruginosavorus]